MSDLIHNPLVSGCDSDSVDSTDHEFPAPMSLPETWKIMEQLQKEGLTRSIGVSNFREEDLIEMESYWTIPPAVNQVRLLSHSLADDRSSFTLMSSMHRI